MEVGKIIKDEGGRWVAVLDKEWSEDPGAGELQDLWSRVQGDWVSVQQV